MDYETKIKKLGNSYAVLIPKEVLQEEGLKENSNVHVSLEKNIRNQNVLKKTYGMLEGWKRTGQEVKDRARRELY